MFNSSIFFVSTFLASEVIEVKCLKKGKLFFIQTSSTSEVKEVDTEATIKISKRVIDTCEEDEDIPLAKKFKLNKFK